MFSALLMRTCIWGAEKINMPVLVQPTCFNLHVAIETSGAVGPRSKSFLRELGRRLHKETGEPNSSSYLLQRLSVAVQRGNAVAILGCVCPS